MIKINIYAIKLINDLRPTALSIASTPFLNPASPRARYKASSGDSFVFGGWSDGLTAIESIGIFKNG